MDGEEKEVDGTYSGQCGDLVSEVLEKDSEFV